MNLGKVLAVTPRGMSVLLSCAHAPRQAGTARTWVPIAHPLQIVPDLYAVPAGRFSCLAADVSEGSEHLAMLADTSGSTLPQIPRTFGLSLAFLLSFHDSTEALVSGAALAGFDFDKYKTAFEGIDRNPGARWFWQPGDELLGPTHYGAALGRLIDRFFEAGRDEEGWNENRVRAASLLGHAAHCLKETALPISHGIEIEHDVLECVPSFMSGFARTSRQGAAPQFLKAIAKALDCDERAVVTDTAFLLRLAPELLAFYLLLWELSKERRCA